MSALFFAQLTGSDGGLESLDCSGSAVGNRSIEDKLRKISLSDLIFKSKWFKFYRRLRSPKNCSTPTICRREEPCFDSGKIPDCFRASWTAILEPSLFCIRSSFQMSSLSSESELNALDFRCSKFRIELFKSVLIRTSSNWIESSGFHLCSCRRRFP